MARAPLSSARRTSSPPSDRDVRRDRMDVSGPAVVESTTAFACRRRAIRILNMADGLVAKRDVEGRRLERVGSDEPPETGGARICLAAAPDRIEVRGDRDQLGEVGIEVAVVGRRVEQAFTAGAAIRIGEDRKAREVDPSAAGEFDAHATGPDRSRALDVVTDRAQDLTKSRLLTGTDRGEHGQRLRDHFSAPSVASCSKIVGAFAYRADAPWRTRIHPH